METLQDILLSIKTYSITVFSNAQIYQEVAMVFFCYLVAYFLSFAIKKYFTAFLKKSGGLAKTLTNFIERIELLLFPIIALAFLKLFFTFYFSDNAPLSLINLVLIIATLLLFYNFVRTVILNELAKITALAIGIPILFFHLTGLLDEIIKILDGTALEAGDIRISIYGIIKVVIFGSLLFWLGRASNTTGKKIIRNQAGLDLRTKEVFSKLFEIIIFFVVCILLLKVMGVNLTALAVFGGAIGVGLGFGLQSIASNFISGIIILLDRSVSLNDHIEMEDGKIGLVTQMTLRATTLETFDGKDVVVPNEKFISNSFVNWTHKDNKQRYRVDFPVAYSTDVRKLVDIIKAVVADHPQVLSGEGFPFEEQPDCEIDSFGDSGINMFVEFWMEGIDDGKNRVGGDLLLAILEAIRNNGFEIPFPQREVRIIK